MRRRSGSSNGRLVSQSYMGAMIHSTVNSTFVNILTDHISKEYLRGFPNSFAFGNYSFFWRVRKIAKSDQ
jgi:hypothetical protein